LNQNKFDFFEIKSKTEEKLIVLGLGQAGWPTMAQQPSPTPAHEPDLPMCASLLTPLDSSRLC
jgi:hypothetical protein